MPDQGAGEEISWSDLKEGDMVAILLDEDGNAESVSIMEGDMEQPGGGQSQQPEEYQAETSYTEDAETEDEAYASEGTDENAVLISEGSEVVLKNPQITRTSQDSTGGDTSSFYGVGAALLASDGNAYVSGGTISTDAAGVAGLFAYDKGTIYASGTTIKTEQDTSGGVHAAGGGSFYGWDLDVITEGELLQLSEVTEAEEQWCSTAEIIFPMVQDLRQYIVPLILQSIMQSLLPTVRKRYVLKD